MHSVPALLAACLVLIYVAITVDVQRKCEKGSKPSTSETGLLKYVNITMLVLTSLSILYCGWDLFAKDSHKEALSAYF